MKQLHFNRIARGLHWMMAAMIFAMLFMGAGMVASLSQRAWLIDLHRPLGIAILLLVVLRVLNRVRNAPPPLPADLPRWQVLAAKGSHLLLYLLMFTQPIVGWMMLSAGGYPVEMFAGFALPPLVTADPALYGWLRIVHALLAWLLFATVLGHLAAALFHAWIRRDGVFESMSRGR
jgi:cytochrome b561